MTSKPLQSDDSGESRAEVSRRGLFGLIASGTAVGVGGIYGLASLTQSAQATAAFDVQDKTVVLDVDEEISSVTLSGTVEFTYSGYGDPGVGSAGIFTDPQSDAGIEFPSDSTGRWDGVRYTDVDPDSDTVTHNFSVTFDVPPEVGDPEPGESIETEITVSVLAQLDEEPEDGSDHPGLPIVERRVNDSGTLRVEREEHDDDDENDDDDDEDDNDDDETREREDTVSGTMTFEVETE